MRIEDPNIYFKKYEIEVPLLYKQNFVHNNCAGRCVKAGQGHFQNLLIRREKEYHKLMEQEIVISEYIRYTKQPAIKNGKQKDYMYKDVWEFVSTGKKSEKIQHIIDTHIYMKNCLFGKDSKGRDIKKPYTFDESYVSRRLRKKITTA